MAQPPADMKHKSNLVFATTSIDLLNDLGATSSLSLSFHREFVSQKIVFMCITGQKEHEGTCMVSSTVTRNDFFPSSTKQ